MQTRKSAQCVSFEQLEKRKLFAAVAWTGAGDGVNWSDSDNWSGGVMPQASDDVTINVAANPNVVVTGNRTVNSLNLAEPLTLSGGATLAVANSATCAENVKLNGGTIFDGNWFFSAGKGFELGNAINKIDAATVNGDLFFNEVNGRTKIAGGTTFTRAHLANNGTSIGFAPGSTIDGQILFEGSANQGRYVEMDGGNGTLGIAALGSIKTAAGFGGIGFIGSSFWNGGAMTLNNSGLISSIISGITLNVNANSMSNTGTLLALNGATLNIAPPTWSSSGTVGATNSTLNFS